MARLKYRISQYLSYMSHQYPFWKDQERAIIESSHQSEVAQLMARIRQLEGRECPNCKKHIQVDAKFCAYCGIVQKST